MISLPSVTTIINAVGLTNYRPGHDRAMAVGKAVHRAVFLLEKGTLDEAALHPEVRPAVEAYKALRVSVGLELDAQEMALEHPAWGFQGHPDALGTLHGEPEWCLFDWKVSDGPDLFAASIQLAAYKMLCEANGYAMIHRCYVGRLGKDGSHSLHDVTSAEAGQIFQAAVILYRARERSNRL